MEELLHNFRLHSMKIFEELLLVRIHRKKVIKRQFVKYVCFDVLRISKEQRSGSIFLKHSQDDEETFTQPFKEKTGID